jgi:hypothetical protein
VLVDPQHHHVPVSGVRFVMICGIIEMLKLFVDNLVIHQMVITITILDTY